MRRRGRIGLLVVLGVIAGAGCWGAAAAQTPARYFYETGHWVRGRFLQYWDTHGGLAQQGYPISDEFAEVSSTDGRPYTVQYFERAVFEYHPENAGTRYEVLLSLLGVDAYRQAYPQGAPGQRPHGDPAALVFPETGKRLGGAFRTYWESHGGLAQQGFPISDEFTEVSALDHQPYTVQYFERAVFEYHPANIGTPYEVLLSQLGTFRHRAHYELAIPPPAAGLWQHSPLGSYFYLVWQEDGTGVPAPGSVVTPTLRALDLRTGQVQMIPVLDNPRLDGTILVGTEGAGGPLVARDLATGTRVVLAPGGASAFAVAGRQVAWVEEDPSGSGAGRILVQTLGGPAAQPVVTLPTGAPVVRQLALSDTFLVWSETQVTTGDARRFTITSLDRAGGAVRPVRAGTVAAGIGGPVPVLSLVGDRLYWTSPLLQETDLGSGVTRQLSAGTGLEEYTIRVSARADAVAWATTNDLWARPLPDGAARRVRTRYAVGVGAPALAGPWLVSEGPDGLTAARLADLFAAAPLPTGTPPYVLTPVPPPTASPYSTAPPTEVAGSPSPTAGP